MRVAISCRVSGKSNRQETENQALALRVWCEREGHEVVEYIDRQTGTRGDRTAFQRVFADATEHKFDMLLFWALDRFSREGTLQTLQYLQRLDKCGIAWRSHMEPHLDTTGPFKDVVIAILSTLARLEHARIQDRLRAARERMKKEGRSWGRPKLVFDRAEVHSLRQDGLSIRHIAGKLGISTGTVNNVLRPLRP
jgi:DNA invertase Pin-like site-specific DNA recombinase